MGAVNAFTKRRYPRKPLAASLFANSVDSSFLGKLYLT